MARRTGLLKLFPLEINLWIILRNFSSTEMQMLENIGLLTLQKRGLQYTGLKMKQWKNILLARIYRLGYMKIFL